MKQLMASGAADYSDLNNFDEDLGVLANIDEAEEDVEIELNEDEAPFLKGQSSHTLNFSPIRIVKNPDGSLQRAAMTQA